MGKIPRIITPRSCAAPHSVWGWGRGLIHTTALGPVLAETPIRDFRAEFRLTDHTGSRGAIH
jgi:hypothetical protein